MTAPIDRFNDGSRRPPRLRRDLNLGTLAGLPETSPGFRASLPEQLAMCRAAGVEGVQAWEPDTATARAIHDAGLRATGVCRVLQPTEVDAVVRRFMDQGLEITTLHVGTGFETDAEMDALAAALLEASARHAHPVYLETHRGTMTQDIRRTLDLVARFPALRFNADLSHWYTGHELNYGGEFLPRLARCAPVLERVRFMHARIGNCGAIQTPLDEAGPYLGHHLEMWTRCFEGFLRGAQPGDVLSFNPELLPARLGEDFWVSYAAIDERSDRWQDAQQMWQMADQAWAEARRRQAGGPH